MDKDQLIAKLLATTAAADDPVFIMLNDTVVSIEDIDIGQNCVIIYPEEK